ncbi:MAG: outer membrane protein assembly factor BamB [Pseudomonadota bacterium]
MKRLLALTPLLLLSACSSSIDPVEPPAELTPIATPALEVSHRWVREIGQGSKRQHLKLAPLVDGERLFVANRSGRVAAYAGADGEKLWQVELDAVVNAGPGGGDEQLLLGGDAEVIALDKADGSLRWRTAVSSEVLSIPQQRAGVVVVHSVDGNITALEADSGERLWQHREAVPTLSLRGAGDPVMLEDGVLAGTANGKVVALSLEEGEPVWENVVAQPRGRTELERMVDVDAELAVAEGVVYASSYQGNLAAIALASGETLWNREIGSASGITLDEDNLYLSDTDGNVWALSRRNGGTMWKQDALLRRALTTPVQQGNYVIVGDYAGHLHWLHKEDGSLAARSRVQTFEEYWPPGDVLETVYDAAYPEDRALLLAPAVEGVKVFGLDKRGVLDAFEVSPVDSGADAP